MYISSSLETSYQGVTSSARMTKKMLDQNSKDGIAQWPSFWLFTPWASQGVHRNMQDCERREVLPWMIRFILYSVRACVLSHI